MNEIRHPASLDDRGASSVEYALLISMIAAVIVASVAAFGGSVGDLFDFTLPG